MPGFAKLQFCSQCSSTLVPSSNGLLDELKSKGILQSIDVKAAYYLTEKVKVGEEVLLLLAFLFAASRMGHLCIEINQKVAPPLKRVWPIEEAREAALLESKIVLGLKKLPPSFFDDNPNLMRAGSYLYLQKNGSYESEIKKRYQSIEQDKPLLCASFNPKETSLSDEQIGAIRKSFDHSLSFIIGGPGVGKTFTASVLIKAFLKQHPQSKIAIVAPTGKAVANLQQYLMSSLKEMEEAVESFTLHKLFHQKITSYLPFDLILVDESSMIDAHFMLLLFKYYKPHSRLILLGDPNQLPPIGSGFVFSDLMSINHLKSELTKCQRTDIKEIVECAEAIRSGDDQGFIQRAADQRSFFNIDERGLFFERIARQIPKVNEGDSLYQKLSAFQKSKVLSPIRKGEFGVDNINQKMRQEHSKSLYHPIMITSNDYRLELFNGDIGLLINSKEAIFFSRHSKESYLDPLENIRKIPTSILLSYELAYCISIHKSQGSEYDFVSIAIPPRSELFSRELLYTAITRAKKGFEIFSTKHTLSELIKNNSRRLSGLSLWEKNE